MFDHTESRPVVIKLSMPARKQTYEATTIEEVKKTLNIEKHFNDGEKTYIVNDDGKAVVMEVKSGVIIDMRTRSEGIFESDFKKFIGKKIKVL
jgi:ribosome maturation factor RimP